MIKWWCLCFLMCFLQVAGQKSTSIESGLKSHHFHSFLEMKAAAVAEIDWNSIETFDQDVTLDLLTYLYNRPQDSTNYFWHEKHNSYGDSSSFEAFTAYHVPHVHLIDIDQDNDLDILYEGYQMPGYNTLSTLVFIRHKKHYFEVVSEDGVIVSLNRLPNKKTELVVFHYPCCSEYTEALKVLEFSKSGTTTIFNQKEAIGFTGILDERLNERTVVPMPPLSFAEITIDSTYLFNRPDSENLLLADSSLVDNEIGHAFFIAQCKSGTTGRILDKYTDELGNEWYFMELDTDQADQFTVYEYAFYDKTLEQFAGWIPAKKCRLKTTEP